MTSPNTHNSRPGMDPLNQVPDYPHFRERAHHHRRMAINSAVSRVWNRFTGRRSNQDWDARFWNA